MTEITNNIKKTYKITKPEEIPGYKQMSLKKQDYYKYRDFYLSYYQNRRNINKNNFFCNFCNYKTDREDHMKIHKNSKKHIKNENLKNP